MYQQYSLKEGLKRFGEKGKYEVNSDLEDLHKMETFEPLNANKFNKEDRTDALASLMLIT